MKQSNLFAFVKSPSQSQNDPLPSSNLSSKPAVPQQVPKIKRSHQDIMDQLIEEAKKKLSTRSKEKPECLDFSRSHTHYDADQKRAILALVPYLRLSEIHEKFQIPINTIKYWMENGVEDKRKVNSGRKAPLRDIETKLFEYFCDLRRLGRPVNNNILRQKMKILYSQEQNITVSQLELAQKFQRSANLLQADANTNLTREQKLSPQEAEELRETLKKLGNQVYVFSDKWLSNFRNRHKIKVRRINHVGQTLPEDQHTRVDDFLKKIFFLRTVHDYPYELILNFDETPVFFYSIPTTTYEHIGIKNVSIKTSNLHKKRLTLGLGISASGCQLRPMIIFQGKENSKFRKLTNYQNYLLSKNDSAWMTEALFGEYIAKVVIPYVEKARLVLKKPNARSLFVIDTFSGHFGTFEELCAQNNIDLVYIPPGTTNLVQPLDLTLNKRIKNLMRKEWLDWYMNQSLVSTEAFTETPKKQAIYNWLSAAFSYISPKEIVKSFVVSLEYQCHSKGTKI